MTKVQEKINPNTGQVIERTVTEPGDSNIKALQENRRKRLRL